MAVDVLKNFIEISSGAVLMIAAIFPQAKNVYAIHELNESQFSAGSYETEGFVIKAYDCEAAVDGGLNGSCDHDYIVISEDKLILGKYFLSDKELIIFVDDVLQFEKGIKYRFLVKILDVKTTRQKLNNLKLVYFEKLS